MEEIISKPHVIVALIILILFVLYELIIVPTNKKQLDKDWKFLRLKGDA